MVNRWLFDLYKTGPSSGGESGGNNALLDAAEQLMKVNGAAATTMMDIANQTGKSVSYVTQQFVDSAGMAQAVYDRFAERARATTLAIIDPMRWTGASIGDIIDAYVRYQLLITQDRNALVQATKELAEVNPASKMVSTSLRSELENGIYALLLTRRDSIDDPRPELATRFVIDQIGAMVRARTKTESKTKGELRQLARYEDDDFVEELIRSSCRTLGVPSPTQSSSESSDSSE